MVVFSSAKLEITFWRACFGSNVSERGACWQDPVYTHQHFLANCLYYAA